jgi:hypothetical protein
MDTRREQTATTEPAGLALAFAVAAAALTVLLRLAPYWFGVDRRDSYFWNLMPVGALGLFAGARLRSAWALLLPMLTMLVADLLLIRPLAAIGQASFSWMTPLIYGSFLVYAVFGRVARQVSWPGSLLAACLLGSVQFFVVTNFLSWLADDGTFYPKTLAGLVQCFTMGLPFFKNTLEGDLIYTGLLFGLYGVAAQLRQREKARQPA